MLIAIACIFLFILWVLWLVLPFAVFGIRKRVAAIERDVTQIKAAILARPPAAPPLDTAAIRKEINLTNRILAAVHNVELPQD